MKNYLLLVLSAFCFMPFSLAGGFQVYLQGNRQIAMGLCGVGLVQDAAGLSINPASLSFLKQNSVYLGGNLILANTAYRQQYPGQYTTNSLPSTGTPFNVYANVGLMADKRMQLGVGVYTPYGSSIAWPEGWIGRFAMVETKLQTIYYQPTIAYRISEKLGVGAGFIYARGSMLLRKALPIDGQDGSEGSLSMQGSGNGFGFNISAFYKAGKQINIGFDYQSSVKLLLLNGQADFSVPLSLAASFPDTKFSSSITLPAMLSFGFGYHPSHEITLAFDINYNLWSSYDTLSFDFAVNNSTLKDIHSPRLYRNAVAFRLGAEYLLKNKWAFRGGAFYDMSPVQDGYLTPETPDSDKIGISFGFGVKPIDRLSIDASFLYAEGALRSDTNIESGFSGSYKTKILIPGLSLQFSF